jgi:ppGpp synthetase/RelA/SpoT-type nucleotidyltranferase
MDKIASTTSLISGIVDAYCHGTFQSTLKSTLKSLESKFDDILTQNADQYNLITSNSVRPIKYFVVVGRVKEKDSFHEKLIRGNLIYSFLKEERFKSRKEISKRSKRTRELIKQISDDIIGIKILTELEDDCKKVISLLKDKYLMLFNDKRKLYLDLDDLEKQPIRMRNGLEFYKIKGIYAESFKFELQIKSKLLSAWGDMDHSMFYKDYSVSPVKENVKNSMVNLGNLIVQVDKFLLQIREAEHSFSKNRDVIDFTEKFSSQYSGLLKSKLGFGYRLEDISEFLFFLYKKLPLDKRNIKARLDFSILTTKGLLDLVRHYIRVRNRDFNLQIIELVYFNWFSRAVTNRERRLQNFNRIIPKMINAYLEFLVFHLRDDFAYYSVYLEENFSVLCEYLNSGALLYNFEKINSFFSTLSNIINYSDIVEGKYSDEQKNYIRNFLLLIYYSENAESYFKDIRDEINANDLILTISSIIFPLQEKKFSEIANLRNAEDLIQRALILLKKLSDELPN